MKRAKPFNRILVTYYLVAILIALSLSCVGFASWTIITFPNGQTATGNLTAYDVIDTNSYVKLDTSKGDNGSGVTMFNISPSGFIVSTGVSNSGTITAHYLINFKNIFANTTFKANGVTIEIYLRGIDYNGNTIVFDSTLKYYSMAVENFTVKNGDNTIAFTGEATDTQRILRITFDASTIAANSTNEAFTLDVNFVYTIGNNGASFLYNLLTDGTNNSNFYIHARIY